MSGYVDHAWRHRPKAQGGTDPVDSASFEPVTVFLSKSPSTVSVTTPWSAQSAITAWTSSSFEGPDVASYLEYDSDVGDGNPGVRILQGGIYVFQWKIWISPQSTGTTNTGKLVPKYSEFRPIHAAAAGATFAGFSEIGTVYQNRNSVLDGGVNEVSVGGGTLPASLAGEETVYIYDDDANLPWIVTTKFEAAAGAHDYSYFAPTLRITRTGNYFPS